MSKTDRVVTTIMSTTLIIAIIAAGLKIMPIFIPSVLISGICGLYLCFSLARQIEKDK